MHASQISSSLSAGSSVGTGRSRELANGPRPRRSILIVDDNPEKTLALQSVVEELDYRIVVANSAEAALRELLKQEFALALLDVHMPGMDGFELARLIRSRPAHADLTIVFMSSIDQTDDRLESAYQLGAIDFISLPARRPLIKAKLAAVLGLQEKTRTLEVFAGESVRRLEQSEDRFRLLFDNAEDIAIFFLNPAGIIVEWSRAAELCTGWSAKEILGREFAVLFVPGDAAAGLPAERLAAARAEQQGVSDRWLVRKDGVRFWARFYLVALRGKRDAGFGVLLRDISSQKNAEQELQIKAEVLDNMMESVCVVDGDLRIIHANPAACRTFGYDAQELVGADLRVLNDCTPEESQAQVNQLLAHLEHHRQWAGECKNRRKDGTPFLTHTRISILQHQGSKYFVCIQEDLTARKQAEAAVQRSAQLQEVVGELEAFSYSVSHDLKSPLRTLRGFADAVLQDYGEALQGPGLHYMQRIRLAAERLERMVEDILTVSRLPRDALPLSQVDLTRVVVSVLEESPPFRPPLAEVAVQGALPVVLGHEPSLRQVLFNLLGNAVKFVPSDRRPSVTIRAENQGGDVILWVEDNGVGLRAEDRERIFSVFERVNTSPNVPGSGIGLAIVKRTVERLGGTVGVHSELGAGSRFWIKLRGAPEGG